MKSGISFAPEAGVYQPGTQIRILQKSSANVEILKVFANVHACPVHRFETANSAALGAALRAHYSHQLTSGDALDWKDVVAPFAQPVTDSTIEPDPAAVATYAELADQYQSLEDKHIN